jgi:hypothetical protein
VRDTPITLDYGPETEPSRMNRNDSGALSMLGRIAQLLAVVGLAVFNVWWYVRDTRPLPPLHTVAASVFARKTCTKFEASCYAEGYP